MSSKEIRQTEALKAAKELKAAFIKLNNIWIEEEEDEVSELLVLKSKYPFKSDFNELTQDVENWINKAAK